MLSVIFDLESKADCVVALHGDGEDGEDAGVRHRQLDVGHKVAHRLKKKERACLALSMMLLFLFLMFAWQLWLHLGN